MKLAAPVRHGRTPARLARPFRAGATSRSGVCLEQRFQASPHQRPFGMAAPRQGLPVRLERAPHRGAAFALSNASKRARIRSIGLRSRGSLFIFRSSPAVAPWLLVTVSPRLVLALIEQTALDCSSVRSGSRPSILKVYNAPWPNYGAINQRLSNALRATARQPSASGR